MIVTTQLDVKHLELIKIFFKANELIGSEIREAPVEIRGRCHMVIEIEIKYPDSAQALTFMGVKHSGVLNMFDDYLMKCGVEVYELRAESIVKQEKEEKEAAENERFMEKLKDIVEKVRTDEHSN